LAGVCFILPAALIVSALAWAYVRWGSLPPVGGVLAGVQPVVIAVVLQALWALGRTALKSRWLIGVAAVCLVAALLLSSPLIVLSLGALLAIAPRLRGQAAAIVPMVAFLPGAAPVRLGRLFLVFLKVGALLFGSGYVLLAFLRADLVQHLGWLSERQLLDAVAVGQVTPGPVFTTATFIGYVLAGPVGAAVATVAIFLPSFVFVAVSGPLVPRIRRSPLASSALDGVIVASLALMAAVVAQLARTALVGPATIAIAVLSAILLFRYRINSAWLVLGGAVLGLVMTLVQSGGGA
jgi:chromate transporter